MSYAAVRTDYLRQAVCGMKYAFASSGTIRLTYPCPIRGRGRIHHTGTESGRGLLPAV